MSAVLVEDEYGTTVEEEGKSAYMAYLPFKVTQRIKDEMFLDRLKQWHAEREGPL